ncbi:uncharacterized protein M421DRAFT_104558 [Didymella exigua CBS 183.55]|uniref:Zn(2)-C6 fungal-type domain-containing protein n=1 Tax=Didymella exigua CBS 183.55 TaxID=1150837 RepID=A0A6A5R7M3_9PLEO|nr:uncharacterized protein M421DRAFT_104558 [Didymella exigua CBS 183.55]KAF1923200.1 hypothetical protein M421DRAFT_104558 [Didymella exigua CBS 183.55]
MTHPHHVLPSATDLKRKRSSSHENMHPAAPHPKAAKTHNHLQINYLVRHLDADLPLITNDDTLPNILSLLSDYQGVLDRHESMACNLGARPLGPILIKRFERLFDGPPRVLKSHGKDGTTVTWLDVVEFARNKPEQFQLGQMSEGVRVCQFYTKQCRVQISEEDFVLISSGIPQKMIPPQPIIEDEEKELGTIEILEKNLGQICQLADQVAARTRQLNHRLKGRRQAILDRRVTASPAPPIRPLSPSNVALMKGGSSHVAQAPTPPQAQAPAPPQAPAPVPVQPSHKSPGGFVAVNARPHESNGHGHGNGNGSSASSTTRHDLLAKFHTVNDRRSSSHNISTVPDARRPTVVPHSLSHPSTPTSNTPRPLPQPAEAQPPPPSSKHARPPQLNEAELQSMMNSPVPIPNTPSNLLPAASQRASQPAEKDDGGPFKTEMVHRMESLGKGERILPPCDRCRRLHMDCLKNLTACMGCTKKHAKCSWKDVREGELQGAFTHPPGSNSNMHTDTSDHESHDRASTASPPSMLSPRHGYASSHIASSSNGHSTPQPQVTAHPPPQQQQPHQPQQQHQMSHQHRPHPQQTPQYTHPYESRIPSGRISPPERDRERERHVETQLQEAAKSSLAQHATTKSPEAKGHEYQTAIAQQ